MKLWQLEMVQHASSSPLELSEHPSGELPRVGAADGHLVQFFETEEFVIDAVTKYLVDGLRAGEPALVIATEEHQHGFARALAEQGWSIAQELSHGQLVFLDARTLLAELCEQDALGVLSFRQVVGVVLTELTMRARGQKVRVYSELVNLLWAEARGGLAQELEEQWNALRDVYSFTLLCGYHIGHFPDQEHAAAFHKVCAAHSHVLPAESYPQDDAEVVRLRQVTLLQQRALALETELSQRRQTELMLRDALRLRDEFLTIASHELRTPLTALSLSLQNLTQSLRAGERVEAQESTQRSSAQLRRLRVLVERLLDVTSMGAGHLALLRERMSLVGAVRQVVEDLADTAQRAGCRVMVLAAGDVQGEWDVTRIDQVISNLLQNALKYGAGAPIEIKIRERDGKALLSIRDQGIGIAYEDQARIFGRFQRATAVRNVSGVGLGLWIVDQIVTAHGGKVSVESKLGSGSTFTVELPTARVGGSAV